MFRFRAYLRRNFIQLPCAFTRLTELITIKTFINIWHLFQPFIVWRNILPLIRKVEWGLQFHKKIPKSISILGAFKSLQKKKVSHNDMTSYYHQHIVCNYGGGGGEKLKVHYPLSWQQLFIYFVLCLCLFLSLFIFTKSLKSLPRSTSSVTDIKMRVSSPLLSVSYSIVLSLPFFFFLFFISLGAKEKRKTSSVLS